MVKLAEKRKQMLDEMAIKMQNDALSFKNELKSLKDTSNEKFSKYEEQIRNLEVKRFASFVS
jgi:hypothetical protein